VVVRTTIREVEPTRESVGVAVLLDEHPLWLDGLERALAAVGVTVAGKATSPEAALDLVLTVQPDALVASMELPNAEMDGVECLRRARERVPGLRLVALSTQHDAFHLAAAAAAGAHAYLPKTVEATELATTVLECLANTDKNVTCISRARQLNGNGATVQPALTPRELEILYLVARGYTNAEIAERLWVTKWTVKFHLANAYRKLGVSNRTQAARFFFEHGLPPVSLDTSA
jgi:DNA-binding NarL/FixJ family response regulator